MGISNIARDLKGHAGVLIEQWADGKFYIVKNRYSGYSSINQEKISPIHPNEVIKMLSNYNDVVVVNYKSIKGYNHRPISAEMAEPLWLQLEDFDEDDWNL